MRVARCSAPQVAVETTGSPACIASSRTSPNGSLRDGLTKQSNAASQSSGRSTNPGITTASGARARSAFHSRPPPTSASRAPGGAARSNASSSTSMPLHGSIRPTVPNRNSPGPMPARARIRSRAPAAAGRGATQLSTCTQRRRSGAGMCSSCQGAIATSPSMPRWQAGSKSMCRVATRAKPDSPCSARDAEPRWAWATSGRSARTLARACATAGQRARKSCTSSTRTRGSTRWAMASGRCCAALRRSTRVTSCPAAAWAAVSSSTWRSVPAKREVSNTWAMRIGSAARRTKRCLGRPGPHWAG